MTHMTPVIKGVLASLAVCGVAAGFAVAQTPARGPAPGSMAPEPVVPSEQQGWMSMFDGKSLTGWDGNPDVWKVENGVITAETSDAKRVGQSQLIWKGGQPADFDWMLEAKLDANVHSGISYRSAVDLTR